MADIIGTYNLRPAIKGNTWDGFTIQIKDRATPNDPWVVTDITGYAIVMTVEQPGNDTPSKTLTIANGKVSIVDAANGVFSVLPFVMDLEAGNYDVKITLTDGSGNIKTRIKGYWPIVEV